jgi:hypothetical protein
MSLLSAQLPPSPGRARPVSRRPPQRVHAADRSASMWTWLLPLRAAASPMSAPRCRLSPTATSSPTAAATPRKLDRPPLSLSLSLSLDVHRANFHHWWVLWLLKCLNIQMVKCWNVCHSSYGNTLLAYIESLTASGNTKFMCDLHVQTELSFGCNKILCWSSSCICAR